MRRVRGPAIPAIVIVLAILYPYYRSWLPNIPIFGEVPSVDTGVTMLIYGTRKANDLAWFPRSRKVWFRGLGVIGRIETLDYHDGEPD